MAMIVGSGFIIVPLLYLAKAESKQKQRAKAETLAIEETNSAVIQQ